MPHRPEKSADRRKAGDASPTDARIGAPSFPTSIRPAPEAPRWAHHSAGASSPSVPETVPTKVGDLGALQRFAPGPRVRRAKRIARSPPSARKKSPPAGSWRCAAPARSLPGQRIKRWRAASSAPRSQLRAGVPEVKPTARASGASSAPRGYISTIPSEATGFDGPFAGREAASRGPAQRPLAGHGRSKRTFAAARHRKRGHAGDRGKYQGRSGNHDLPSPATAGSA